MSIRRIPIAVVALALALPILSATAGAQGVPTLPAQTGRSGPTVDVIEVNGRIDPIEADFVARSLDAAAKDRSELLVIQLDSPGVLLSRSDLDVLLFRISHSAVPVAVWVGPTGSRAHGDAVAVAQAAAVSGIAPGAHIGRSEEIPRSLGADAAKARSVVDVIAPTLGDFIVGLDGREIAGSALHTARVVDRDGQPRREIAGNVRFAKLGLLERILHTAASPQVAYLLLVIGLTLVVFEFFTVGIGLAGLVGAGSLVLAAYGLAVLPASWWALALIGLGFFGYAVDVQAGAPRAWTIIGTVALVAGSFLLFPNGLEVPWYTIILVVAGVAVFMVAGMASMIRARFSTPTIGRESMIGEMAEATTGIDPDGMVRLRGGLWRARTSRVTPIDTGAQVRVTAIDGLVLEVEPEDAKPGKFEH